MNKKLFLGMFAAAGMLLATSCSNDELDVVQSGNEAQVTFSLAAEGGIATRTISDGKSADLLYYAIFDADKNLITTIANSENGLLKKENAFPNQNKKDEVTVTLAKGQEYTAVFWAQDTDCKAYTVTAEQKGLKVAVDYEGDNNDETRDAFFKAETFKVTGNAKIDVELKRPFAQINVGVTDADWNAAVASGITISESKVVIKNAATSINLLDGTVSGEQAVEYDFATIPANANEVLAVDVDADGTIEDSEKYKYLSMSYILVNDENGGSSKTTLEADGLQFTFKSGGSDIVFDEGLHAVPVQRNWRTNILGKLLTGDIDFTIVINPIYDGDYNIIDGTESTNEIASGVTVEGNTYRISSADGLKWLADVVNGTATTTNGYTEEFAQSNFYGKTVVLTNDIDLANVDWTPISDGCKVAGDGLGECFSGTFDGGNHTISNMTVEGKGYVGLFATAVGTIKNVKMRNVSVKGTTFVGAVIGYIYGTIENCHVDGGNVTAVLDEDDNNGNNVGGIVGFVGEGKGVVTGNSVKNLNVTAYRTVGGIAGRVLSSTTVTNNILDNVAVVADMLQDGGETVDQAKAGQVVGDNMANADLSSNTVNNVTVNVYGIENGVATVGTVDGATYAINNGATTINLTDGEYDATKLTAIAGKTLTFIGSGENTIFDYTSQKYNQYVNGNSGNFTFKNMTIERSTETFAGMAHTSSTSYENCKITGTYYVYETTANFTKCKFIVTGDVYNCWLYGTSTTTYTECTFDCSGKSIYVDGNGSTGSDLTAEKCTFNDNGGVENKAAIETGNTYGKRYSLTINETTVNGFSVTEAKSQAVEGANLGTNVWGNKNYMTSDKLSVTIDGTKVY